MGKVHVRFAPSPTGALHIGGVRTALFNWLWARKTGGSFILRIEDTDQERCTSESKKLILDSLHWLGIDWDEGPEVGGEHGPYTQMERLSLYKEYAERLIAEGKAFRCYKTRDELERARLDLKEKDPKRKFKYPKEWREQIEKSGEPYAIRFKSPLEGSTTYVDKVFGEITTPNEVQQDFILMRSDGIPLYNFGSVIDDVTMGITLVARGRDHMVNTPPQICIYNAIGAKIPDFAHLPMMLNREGNKLSKRDGAVNVMEYRNAGYAPDAVLNYLVRFGWSHGDQEVFSKAQLVSAFDWEHCSRSDGKFDERKFLSIQYEHMKNDKLLSSEEYIRHLVPFLKSKESALTKETLGKSVAFFRERYKTFLESADSFSCLFGNEMVFEQGAVEKFLIPENENSLREIVRILRGLSTFDVKNIKESITSLSNLKNLEMKNLTQVARVALTGKSASPGLYEIMEVLGKDVSIERLLSAADKCKT